MKKTIVLLLIVILCSVVMLSACDVSYNPMKDDDFMEKVMFMQMLLAGQSFENETYFAPQPDSAYKGWSYELVEDKAFKKTYSIKTNTHFSAFGNNRIVSAYEYSRFMQPVKLTLKKDELIVSDNVNGTFTLNGKQFSNYTSKDYILRNSSLEGEALPTNVCSDAWSLQEWMKENKGAPEDFEIYYDPTVQITCRFDYPVGETEMMRFMFYRSEYTIYNFKGLVKIGDNKDDIVLQDSWRVGMMALAQLKWCSSEEWKDGINLIARSQLFDLYDFDIEEAYRAVNANQQPYLGFICETNLSKIADLYTHIDELGEDNNINVIDIKIF